MFFTTSQCNFLGKPLYLEVLVGNEDVDGLREDLYGLRIWLPSVLLYSEGKGNTVEH